MTYPIPTNPPWVMGSSLLTVRGMSSSLETVFAMGSPPLSVFTGPSSLTGLLAWFDASAIAGVSSGASLSAWTDLSGNAHHLRQTSAASQPIFLTNVQNSLSVVSGIHTIPSLMTTVGFTMNEPVTAFLTYNLGGSSITQQKDFIDGVTPASMILGPIGAADFQAFGGSTAIDSLFSLSNATWVTAGAVFNGSSTTVFASSKISVGNAGGFGKGGICVFARADKTNAAPIQVGELVFYSRVLNSVELSQVTTYLRNKWATV